MWFPQGLFELLEGLLFQSGMLRFESIMQGSPPTGGSPNFERLSLIFLFLGERFLVRGCVLKQET